MGKFGGVNRIIRRQGARFELINQPSGWAFEAAYCAEIAVVTE